MDNAASKVLNADLPMMMLYGEDAFTIRYLTLIPFAMSPLLKTVMIGNCPNTWTCSPKETNQCTFKR